MSRNYRSSSKIGFFDKLVILFLVVVTLSILCRCAHSWSYATSEQISYTATVTRMEVKEHNNESKYLVFTRLTDTDEVYVFQITDSFFHGRFDSSDLYGSIEEGKTYIFIVYGYRTEELSEYENILSVEEISLPSEEEQ